MASLTLLSIIAIVLCIIIIISSLIYCIFKYRRCPGSTVDPVEYVSDNKKKMHKIVTTTITTSNDYSSEKNTTETTHGHSYTPTTTSSTISPSTPAALEEEPLSEKYHESYTDLPKKSSSFQEFNISLPLPPPSTSFFADKMELNSEEANRLYELYMVSSTDNNKSKEEFVSIDMDQSNKSLTIYDTFTNIQQKAATIKSNLRQSIRRQKSTTKKTNPSFNNAESEISKNKQLPNDHQETISITSKPNPKIKNSNKDDQSMATSKSVTNSVRPSLHDITSWWSINDKSENNSIHHLQKEESLHSFLNDNISIDDKSSLFQQNQSSTTSKSIIDEPYSFSPNSTCSRATLKKYRKALLEQNATDNEDEDKEVDDDVISSSNISFDYSNNSIIINNNDDENNDENDGENDDIISKEDSNENIFSIFNNNQLNDKENYGGNDKNNHFEEINISSYDSIMPSKKSEVSDNEIKTYSFSNTDNYHQRSIRVPSTYQENKIDNFAMNRLSMMSASSDNTIQQIPLIKEYQEKLKDEVKIIEVIEEEQDAIEEAKEITQQQSGGKLKVHQEESKGKDSSKIGTNNKSQEAYQNSFDKSVSSISTVIQQGSSYVTNTNQQLNNSNNNKKSNDSNNNSNVESVRRVLQSTWNSNRLSENGTISSNRSNLSQGKSPPGSVNPRQLNKYLASLSVKGQKQSHHRPGLPTGFMANEELVIQQGPEPTASFSSSTVRTMIPEDEPIESHVGKKAVSPKSIAQVNNNRKSLKESVNNKTAIKSKNKQPFGTMKTNQQQRATIPWSDSTTKQKNNEKTPAQRERDRYLQSLKKGI